MLYNNKTIKTTYHVGQDFQELLKNTSINQIVLKKNIRRQSPEIPTWESDVINIDYELHLSTKTSINFNTIMC